MFELAVMSFVSIYFTILLLGFLLRTFLIGSSNPTTKFM